MRKSPLVPAVLLLVGLWQAPAHAAFPGRNGRIAFATFSNVFSVTPHGGDIDKLSNPRSAKNRMPSWSADGRDIVFVCRGNAYSISKGAELCTMRADGSQQRRLTHNRVGESSPSWSPDGRWITFMRSRPGTFDTDIWIMRGDGSHMRNVTPDAHPDFYPRWSPDGRKILYMSSRPTMGLFTAIIPSGEQDLFTVSVRGGTIRNITNSNEHENAGDWSPDGRRIVLSRYSEDDSGGWGLYVMSARGGAATPITRGIFATSPAWSPDGRWIAFSAITDVGPNGSLNNKDKIMKVHPDGSGLTAITRRPKHRYYSPDWQPVPASAR